MKKLRNLPTRVDKTGRLVSWAVFWCDGCKQEVERRLGNGLIAKSCGCIKNKNNKNNYKHGGRGTRLYRIYYKIKFRCSNINNKYYGGRGITICSEWAESYIKFKDWSLSNGYADNLVIDRKDPDGNYEPSNCRWLTVLESNRNKTNTITIQIANEIRALDKTGDYTQKELAEMYNVSQPTISDIINNKRW